MGWFKRIKEGITTKSSEKKEIPEGLWYQCPECKTAILTEEFQENLSVCKNCGYHEKIGSAEYFSILFDGNRFEEIAPNVISGDPLGFKDTKKYTDRIEDTIKKTNLKDAIRVGKGPIDGHDAVVACMDFAFIGGSMGSVVGEKFARGVDAAIDAKCPFICITKSGGARMMEAGFSLMQMAKTSAKLSQLSDNRLPYVAILTNPTTGGITASFAMLGDLNIAEPKALIGFAGPRVVKETIGKDLPEGFQTSEFTLEKGFLDYIVDRKDLKSRLSRSLKYLRP
jgi:acetyl-CoA carboxylase carboxyl transferase subunit beta